MKNTNMISTEITCKYFFLSAKRPSKSGKVNQSRRNSYFDRKNLHKFFDLFFFFQFDELKVGETLLEAFLHFLFNNKMCAGYARKLA